MNITPLMPTPLTDIFGGLVNFQNHPECAYHELRVVDCLEAYGITRGDEKCRLLMGDFRECLLKYKQNARVAIMHCERQRQFDAAERKKRYADDIVVDSY